MTNTLLPYLVLAACGVLAIIALSWRMVSRSLSHTEKTAIYDIEEAADFVADGLPAAINDQLVREQVIAILNMHLAHLRSLGMATFGGVDEVAMQAAEAGNKDKQSRVTHEDDAVDDVLAAAKSLDMGIPDVHLISVVDLSNQYLASIGALGPSRQL